MIVGFLSCILEPLKKSSIMIYAVIIGFRRIPFSKYLNVRAYRLEQYTLYVPFGHAIYSLSFLDLVKVSII
jgi:hypothetical protein